MQALLMRIPSPWSNQPSEVMTATTVITTGLNARALGWSTRSIFARSAMTEVPSGTATDEHGTNQLNPIPKTKGALRDHWDPRLINVYCVSRS